MYVKSRRDELQSVKLPEMDSIARFSDNNIAQVTESDGRVLVNYIDHISKHNN